MNTLDKALIRLAAPNAVLARRAGSRGFAVAAKGDKRRRALAWLREEDVRALASAGAIAPSPHGEGYALSAAGRARVARARAALGEEYAAQHATLGPRATVDASGHLNMLRGVALSSVIQRLSALRNSDGAPWLSGAELAAAARLRAHWEKGQAGLVRGSDLTAPPNANAGRGVSSAQEAAMAARCDARRTVEQALDALAAPLRRIVERACLHEEGIEALERAEGWPARSGKVALKLGLAQLASSF